MSAELVRCGRAIAGGETRLDFSILIRDGRIERTGPYSDFHGDPALRHVPTRAFPPDRLVVPGFVNGHSHAYQILLRGWADDWTFAKWRSDALYRVVPQLTPDDVYWIFVAAFAEMLAAGITTVAEFFYLNGGGNGHAEAAIRAAQDTGIRLIFARTWMDAEYAPTQFRESIELAATRTLELRQKFPDANVCVAPHSLHAASRDMIRAAAHFAETERCMLHVHVAEAEYEGKQTLEAFGYTPVSLLGAIGALNERTVAIHAIYLTEDEKDELARSGARVIHNPMTNQYLGDGICDVTGFQARGVTVGLGTDADVKPSLIDEMRAASLLQKIRSLDGSALGAKTAFDLGTAQGGRALGAPVGDLAPGMAADYVVLDARNIDPWTPECNAVVYRADDRWVQAAFVGGNRVYTGEPSELAARARTKTAKIAMRLLA